MPTNLNAVLSDCYKEFDKTVDVLVMDPRLSGEFVTKLQKRIGESLDKQAVLRRLMNLRKNGKLPRLGRK